jgi:hypothetical protein
MACRSLLALHAAVLASTLLGVADGFGGPAAPATRPRSGRGPNAALVRGGSDGGISWKLARPHAARKRLGWSMQAPGESAELLLSTAVSASDAWRYFFAGGMCCCISHGVTVPIDVVKTRMQTGR